jgi:hypoxanthine phosphoribosyltransferase
MEKPKILITKEKIEKRVAELGKQITRDYAGKTVTVIGVLKGSIIFLSDLIRHIDLPLFIDFIEVSSYGDETKSSGVVKIIKDLSHSIEGHDVLIVEDIIDTGITMEHLLKNLENKNPRSLKICTFLEKPINAKISIKIDYQGFTIEDKFVIGYGLDHKGFMRNLEYIGYIET